MIKQICLKFIKILKHMVTTPCSFAKTMLVVNIVSKSIKNW